jgi:hypothetical protein
MPEQTETVRFFTENPFPHFNRTLRELAIARGLDLRESARLLGYVNVASADTLIACGHACGTAALTESLRDYFGTKHVELVMSSTAAGAGAPRTYENLDDLVADVENARVWGGLHYRTTMTRTAKYFPRIARDVGRKYFLDNDGRKGDKHNDD